MHQPSPARARVAIGLAIAFLLVCSCSAKTGARSASGPTSTTTTVAGAPTTSAGDATPVRWTANGLHPASQQTASPDAFFVTALDADRNLVGVALDAATGKELWHHRAAVDDRILGAGLLPPLPVQGANGWVVVQLETGGGQVALGPKLAYVGRDARTGRQLWRATVVDSSEVDPCGPLVCIEAEDGLGGAAVLGLDPTTGHEKWSIDAGAGFVALQNDASGMVVTTLGAKPVVFAVDAVTGRKRWTFEATRALGAAATTDRGWNSTEIGGKLVVALGGTTSTGMFALDLRSGALGWVRKGLQLANELVDVGLLGALPTVERVLPLLAETAREGSSSTTVTAILRLDPATGSTTWTVPVTLTYDEKSTGTSAVRSADQRTIWILDASGRQPARGIELATGRSAPAGVGWQQSFSFQDTIRIAGQSTSDGGFAAPEKIRQVRVRDLADVVGGTPPDTLGTRSAHAVSWIGGDGLVHGAPAG